MSRPFNKQRPPPRKGSQIAPSSRPPAAAWERSFDCEAAPSKSNPGARMLHTTEITQMTGIRIPKFSHSDPQSDPPPRNAAGPGAGRRIFHSAIQNLHPSKPVGSIVIKDAAQGLAKGKKRSPIAQHIDLTCETDEGREEVEVVKCVLKGSPLPGSSLKSRNGRNRHQGGDTGRSTTPSASDADDNDPIGLFAKKPTSPNKIQAMRGKSRGLSGALANGSKSKHSPEYLPLLSVHSLSKDGVLRFLECGASFALKSKQFIISYRVDSSNRQFEFDLRGVVSIRVSNEPLERCLYVVGLKPECFDKVLPEELLVGPLPWKPLDCRPTLDLSSTIAFEFNVDLAAEVEVKFRSICQNRQVHWKHEKLEFLAGTFMALSATSIPEAEPSSNRQTMPLSSPSLARPHNRDVSTDPTKRLRLIIPSSALAKGVDEGMSRKMESNHCPTQSLSAQLSPNSEPQHGHEKGFGVSNHGHALIDSSELQNSARRSSRLSKESIAFQPKTTPNGRPAVAKDSVSSTGYCDADIALVWPFNAEAEVSSVAITRGDLKRLEEGEFLNDTLIEFGLKWELSLIQKQNSDLAQSIHLFNSFFFQKLNTKAPHKCDAAEQARLAYAGVRKWTKGLDVFKKKYLVIPINEHMHWYLMIVSNPGKVLEVTPTTRQPASPPAPSSSRALRSNKQRNTEDQETSVLGTLLKPEQAREEVTSRFFEPMSHDPGCETRVETTGTGEQFEPVGTPRGEVPTRRLQDMGLDDVRLEGAEESPTCVEPSVLENPYVLTLDSLGASHRPQSQTVLRYLLHEAEDKLNRSLSDLLLKSVEVKKVSVPEQPNYCDCGLYLIHAFKVFFSNPTAKLQWILDNGKSRKKSGDSWQAEVCQTWNASGATQARKGLKEKILRLIPEYHEVENQKKMQDSLAAQTAKVPPLNMRIDINPPKRRRLDFMSDNPPGAELQSRVQQPQSERRCLVESGAVTNPQENVQIREEIEGLSLHKAGHPNSGQRSPQSRSPPSSPSIVSVHEISNQNISVTKARSTIESVKTEDFEMMSSDLERRLKEPLKAHSGQHTGIEDVPPGLINHMLNSVGASGPSENANKGVGSGRPGTDPDRVSTPPGSPKSAATAGTPLGDPSPSGALLPDMLDVHPNEGMPCGSLATSIYLNPSLSSLPDHYVTHPGLHAFEYCGSREVNEFKNWGLEAEAFRDLRCQPGPGPDVSAFEHKRNPGDCEHSVGAKITRRSKKPRISPPVERPGQYDSRAIDQRPKSESGGEHNPLAVDDD